MPQVALRTQRKDTSLAVGQNLNRLAPSEHANPTTKIGSKMGDEFTYPKMVPVVSTHGHLPNGCKNAEELVDGVILGKCQTPNWGASPPLAMRPGSGALVNMTTWSLHDP